MKETLENEGKYNAPFINSPCKVGQKTVGLPYSKPDDELGNRLPSNAQLFDWKRIGF